MRRRLLLALLLVLLSAGLPARADFHGACLGVITGVARVDLISNLDGTFTYSGTVNCTGKGINITSVTFVNLTTFQEGDAINETSKDCATSPCTASDTASVIASAGDLLEVRMKFDVTGTVYMDVPRMGRWIYQADGVMVPICVSGLFSAGLGDCT